MTFDQSASKGAGSGGTQATHIRTLNDAFRRDPGRGGVMITAGLRTLASDRLMALLVAVGQFNAFSAGNDPHDEHDFGAIEFDGSTYFWKIDYYDLDRQFGSPDPGNLDVTSRVLTIMRADEY